jgi:hypothetical protein
MKQTAVEWLWRWMNDNQEATIEEGNKAFEQAKEMEKDQITQAVYDGMGTNFDPNMGRAEQYYNETYNK